MCVTVCFTVGFCVMKKAMLYLFAGWLGLFAAAGAKASVFIGEDRYTIKEEVEYTILLYDYTNLLILSFLGSDGKLPDQRLEIEQIRAGRPDDVRDAELRVALIKGNMNLPEFKQKVIAGFRENNVSILEGKYDLQKLGYVGDLFAREVEKVMAAFRKQGGINFEDALLASYMFDPAIDYDALPKDAVERDIHSAVDVAVSRLDNLQQRDEIQACMRKNGVSLADGIIKCADDYSAIVTIETVLVLKQMKTLKKYFEQIKPLSPEDEMVKIEDEKGHSLWGRKK